METERKAEGLWTAHEYKQYLEAEISRLRRLKWKAFFTGKWFLFKAFRKTLEETKQLLKEQ
ncbi:TPA: hypothetical protein DF272_01365 [Candidatus Falkowbacteria bacterium]|nr:hypothetical protein [Candidatus Falkowbacteria bacterium]